MVVYDTAILEDDSGKKQKVRFKKGALHRQLKIPEDQDIPKQLLRKLKKAEVGDSVVYKKKNYNVTTLMKRRVNFAFVLMGKK